LIELGAGDAALDGWTLEMAMGDQVIRPMNPMDLMNQNGQTATFTVDIPCADTWHVWVRGRDQMSADSFFVQVDAAPDMPPIFEVDCTNGGSGWEWNELNWRDPNADACDYVEDPWIQDWGAGQHTVTFMPRESIGITDVTVTNDDAFVP
jgi:hypothetical protein